MDFSPKLAEHPSAQNPKAQDRIHIALARIPNVLEKQTVAHRKTLEQKISDQGPNHLRVDPQLLGLAIQELHEHRRTITHHPHPPTRTKSWYANAGADADAVQKKLAELAPLYASVSTGNFPNLIGDALEVIVYKALLSLNQAHPRYAFHGVFDVNASKDRHGRYSKTEPPQIVSGHRTHKVPDFILYGFDSGPICIECKNLREWFYPGERRIKDLIKMALDLHVTPLFVARRIHYTTIRNFLEPAGIIAHETYYQYYPTAHQALADRVKHKRSLGFSDIRATEDPHPRTIKFFQHDLMKVADKMAERFRNNETALSDYVGNEINLAQ